MVIGRGKGQSSTVITPAYYTCMCVCAHTISVLKRENGLRDLIKALLSTQLKSHHLIDLHFVLVTCLIFSFTPTFCQHQGQKHKNEIKATSKCSSLTDLVGHLFVNYSVLLNRFCETKG